VPFEAFRQEFQSRVTSIGHILAMMAPWDCPVYVTRVRPFIFTVLAGTLYLYTSQYSPAFYYLSVSVSLVLLTQCHAVSPCSYWQLI